MDWKRILEIYRLPIFTLGQTKLTIETVAQLLLMAAIVVAVSRLIRRTLRRRVLSRTRLDPGLQYAIARIVGYIILVIGIAISLSTLGIDLTSLTVLAGALGVGIGFGLQNIVNNFVSGLIILSERVVQIGDRVQVAGTIGRVIRIGARSTSILTNDNINMIVPNSEFVSTPVVNWSYAGDASVRLRVPIGVSYGSNPREVERLLLEVAGENPHVQSDPAPVLAFTAFGESSLDFELRIWTQDMTFTPGALKSQIYYAAWDKLKQHGIEIPFPQRDLHVKEAFKVEVVAPMHQRPASEDP